MIKNYSRLCGAVVGLSTMLSATSTIAADMDQMIGLIVAGEVEKSTGVQLFDYPSFGPFQGGDDLALWSGTAGKMSLPLGPNLSIQSDVWVEYNDQAFDAGPHTAGLRYGFQGATHLSFRDPNQGLFGVFGGAGTSHYAFTGDNKHYDFRFVGGEVQGYLDNLTLYAQGGFIDVSDEGRGPRRARAQRLDDGMFARGVARYFFDMDSRIQGEFTYASLDRVGGGQGASSNRDVDVLSWGARYDTRLSGLPIIGDSNVFIGYRGTHRDNCFQQRGGQDLTDHTVMVGFTYHWGATSMMDNDRRGATLDTPNFTNIVTCGGPGGRP